MVIKFVTSHFLYPKELHAMPICCTSAIRSSMCNQPLFHHSSSLVSYITDAAHTGVQASKQAITTAAPATAMPLIVIAGAALPAAFCFVPQQLDLL